MDLNPINCLMMTLNSVIAHVERADRCYRDALKDEEKATKAAKKKGMFSSGKMHRAMNQAITATEMGTKEMKAGFSKLPRHCPLRKRYPMLMSDIGGDDAIVSLPDLRNSGGDNDNDNDDFMHNLEIIRQCLQICKQQKQLLCSVKSTIEENHMILIRPNAVDVAFGTATGAVAFATADGTATLDQNYGSKITGYYNDQNYREGDTYIFVENKMEIMNGRSHFNRSPKVDVFKHILDLDKSITDQKRINMNETTNLPKQQQDYAGSTDTISIATAVPVEEVAQPKSSPRGEVAAYNNSNNETIAQPTTTTTPTMEALSLNSEYSSGSTNKDFNKKRLIAYYTKHNPEKLDSVDKLLERYSSKNDESGGGIPEMFHKLETKYHENVNEVWLTSFMIKYNKEQSSSNDIHQIMDQYKGKEELMFLELTVKYHDPPIVYQTF